MSHAGDRARAAEAKIKEDRLNADKKKAAAKAAAAPLTPKDIVGVLEGRGWEATIVESIEVDGLVPVDPKGILKCVDGRGSDNTRMRGPKMLGGAYAIANNRGISTTAELKNICQEITDAGHVPSVHGDAGGMMGCGFCKLWINGKFEGLGCTPPDFTAEEGGEAVADAGGVVEMHYGSHTEKVVYINFVPDKTLEPNHDDQRFIVDAWAAGKFNLDIPKYLVTAAATVERLGGPKKAVLIVGGKSTVKRLKSERSMKKIIATPPPSGPGKAVIGVAAAALAGLFAALSKGKKEVPAPAPVSGRRR